MPLRRLFLTGLVLGSINAYAENIFVETDGVVVIEAEEFAHQTKDDVRRWYRFETDESDPQRRAKASGDAYIEILPDTRVTHDDELIVGENFTNKPGVMAVLSYPVQFSEPGRYYIWARAFSTGSEDNGVHFGLNGNWPETSARLQWCEGKHQWTWSSARRVPENHCGDPLTSWIDVPTAGSHTLQISMREDGVEIDKVILAKDESFAP